MIYCPHCEKPSIGKSATCPHCGKNLPKKKIAQTKASNPPQKSSPKMNKQAEPIASDLIQQQIQKQKTTKLRLGEILIAAGIINEEQLNAALEQQKNQGLRLGTILVQETFINESHLVQALSHQAGIRWIDLNSLEISKDLLELIPLNLAENYLFFPIDTGVSKKGKKVLFLAMDNPLDNTAIRAAEAASGMRVEPLFAAPSDIANTIKQYSESHQASPLLLTNIVDSNSNSNDSTQPSSPQPSSTVNNVVQRQIFVVSAHNESDDSTRDSQRPNTEDAANEQLSQNARSENDEGQETALHYGKLSGSTYRMVTLLNGMKIPWASEEQDESSETPEDIPSIEGLLAELEGLTNDPRDLARMKEYLVALLEILFRKHLIFPQELAELLSKKNKED
ncbi:MAG: hypothetical protein GY847_30690 [Proteobacteria bacterium]|nr:hypothetical protein [Pseudomonadota bacterium]